MQTLGGNLSRSTVSAWSCGVCGQCFKILPPKDGRVKSFGIILFELMSAFAGKFAAALTLLP